MKRISTEEEAAERCERSCNPSLCLKEGQKNSAFRANLQAICFTSSLGAR